LLQKIMNRTLWQGIILLTFLVFGFLHAHDNIYPSAHALCPFGGLVSIYSVIAEGTFVHRTHGSSLFLMVAVILSAILLGRIFCGWFCPLGTLGEWSRRLGKRLGIRKIEIDGLLDILLKSLKYILLGAILYLVWSIGELFYKGWCPWSAFMTVFEPDELIEDVLMGGIILVVVLGLSLSIERFFCRYLCPLGAALSIFNRFSLIKPIRREECRNCNACNKVCPVDIDLTSMETINDSNCIRCYKCVDKCPEKGAFTFNKKSLKSYQAGLIAVLVIGITITSTIQMGYWERGRTLSSQGLGSTQATMENIDLEFQEITANKSLEEISEMTGLSVATIIDAWNLPDSYSSQSTLREVSEETGLSRRQLIIKLTEQP